MSSSRNRRAVFARLLAAALCLAAATPRSAAGFELRAWPLLEVKSHGAESEWHLLGPLVEWRRDAESTAFAIRPLFYRSASTTGGSSRGTFLYPVAWWDSSPEDLFLRVLGLATYRHSSAASPASAYTTQLTIFPILFFRRGPAVPTSFSLLPLYADVNDFFGYQRIRMLLFPLYLKLVEPLDERTWVPFPFYSWVDGREGSGWRLWPIYGRTILGGESETTYIGWPLYIRSVVHPGRDGQVTTRISWPLYSTIESPKLESRSYVYLLVLPLYTHTIDRKADTETYGFPWPFWVYEIDRKTGERQSLRLAPFYQDRRTDSMRSVFYLWPVYRHRIGRGEATPYERTDLFLVFYRDQSEDAQPKRQHISALVPLWVSREDGDTSSTQVPTLFDGLLPKNEDLQRLYAPLYRVYGSEIHGREIERDVLWRMWVWGGGKFRPPWYFSLD